MVSVGSKNLNGAQPEPMVFGIKIRNTCDHFVDMAKGTADDKRSHSDWRRSHSLVYKQNMEYNILILDLNITPVPYTDV
jgi:hypothetical protein